jgi:hypothetical protein
MRWLAIRLTRRFLRWLDPTALFNSDMSLVVDRQGLKLEEHEATIKRLQAESAYFLGKYLCTLDVPESVHQEYVALLAKAERDFIGAKK